MSRFFAALLSALMLLSLISCGTTEPEVPPAEEPAEEEVQPEPAPEPEPTPEELAAQEIETLLASMTIEEKVGQLFFVRCPAENAVEDISSYHLGGYILFGRDTKDKTANDLIQTIASYQSAAKIPLLMGVDEEGGTVVRISSNPHLRSCKFQSPQKVCSNGGMEGLVADTAEKDRLLSALGFNVNLAPVADLSTEPNDFIYERTFCQDAETTAELVEAVVTQMRQDSMGSALKHFPGYGNNVDTHTGIAIDSRSLTELEFSDLIPFAAGIEAGADAILVSHTIVEALDPQNPASLSPGVHQYLRGEMGFEGVIVTDDLVMQAITDQYGAGESAVLAVLAGNDLLCSTEYAVQYEAVYAAVLDGRIDIDTLNNAVRNVLEWKMELGLIS